VSLSAEAFDVLSNKLKDDSIYKRIRAKFVKSSNGRKFTVTMTLHGGPTLVVFERGSTVDAAMVSDAEQVAAVRKNLIEIITNDVNDSNITVTAQSRFYDDLKYSNSIAGLVDIVLLIESLERLMWRDLDREVIPSDTDLVRLITVEDLVQLIAREKNLPYTKLADEAMAALPNTLNQGEEITRTIGYGTLTVKYSQPRPQGSSALRIITAGHQLEIFKPNQSTPTFLAFDGFIGDNSNPYNAKVTSYTHSKEADVAKTTLRIRISTKHSEEGGKVIYQVSLKNTSGLPVNLSYEPLNVSVTQTREQFVNSLKADPDHDFKDIGGVITTHVEYHHRSDVRSKYQVIYEDGQVVKILRAIPEERKTILVLGKEIGTGTYKEGEFHAVYDKKSYEQHKKPEWPQDPIRAVVPGSAGLISVVPIEILEYFGLGVNNVWTKFISEEEAATRNRRSNVYQGSITISDEAMMEVPWPEMTEWAIDLLGRIQEKIRDLRELVGVEELFSIEINLELVHHAKSL